LDILFVVTGRFTKNSFRHRGLCPGKHRQVRIASA
jgi:hypothetical protein